MGALGTPSEHGTFGRGGFAQAQCNLNRRWQINLAYGIDQTEAFELR
ncbi:MAG TPA: hypothetical protein VEV17_03310 [Bryobacteraceae bacterium]|nr:hypothetical protein [Bryobacteraceae bacterium]